MVSLIVLKDLIVKVFILLKEVVLDKVFIIFKMLFSFVVGGRVNVKKILVVMIDRELDSSSEDVMKFFK